MGKTYSSPPVDLSVLDPEEEDQPIDPVDALIQKILSGYGQPADVMAAPAAPRGDSPEAIDILLNRIAAKRKAETGAPGFVDILGAADPGAGNMFSPFFRGVASGRRLKEGRAAAASRLDDEQAALEAKKVNSTAYQRYLDRKAQYDLQTSQRKSQTGELGDVLKILDIKKKLAPPEMTPYQKAQLDLAQQKFDRGEKLTPYQEQMLQIARAREERLGEPKPPKPGEELDIEGKKLRNEKTQAEIEKLKNPAAKASKPVDPLMQATRLAHIQKMRDDAALTGNDTSLYDAILSQNKGAVIGQPGAGEAAPAAADEPTDMDPTQAYGMANFGMMPGMGVPPKSQLHKQNFESLITTGMPAQPSTVTGQGGGSPEKTQVRFNSLRQMYPEATDQEIREAMAAEGY